MLGLSYGTVSRILNRAGLNRLRSLDPPPPVVRYKHKHRGPDPIRYQIFSTYRQGCRPESNASSGPAGMEWDFSRRRYLSPSGCPSVNGDTVHASILDDSFDVGELFKHDYRDSKEVCSTHAAIAYGSNQVNSHIDAYNPNLQLKNHLRYELLPDLFYDLTGSYLIPPGRRLCE